jgi:EmrB/QacA subfamily drug resistance transporter
MSITQETHPASTLQRADPGRWLTLAVVLVAGFMDLLDAGIVFLALPRIQQDLHAGYAALQWVAAGYTLAFALALITAGRLGDILGRKRLFLVGVAGFTAASALCAAAQSPAMLVASRALQGAMAAVMIPQVLSIIQASFAPGERAAAFGAYGAAAGLANVSGPVIAGLLIQADPLSLGWRSIFLINLPVGIATLVAAWLLVGESKAPQALRLDPAGVAIITVALLALLYPLVQGRELGWPAWSFAAMAAAVPLLALFTLWERHKTRRDGSPLVPLGLFGRRAFVAGLAVTLLVVAGITGFFLVFVLYVQTGLGFSTLKAALVALPWPLGIALAGGISARLAATVGRRLLTLGSLLVATAMAALVWTIHHDGPGIAGWQLMPDLAVGGLGMGLVFPPLGNIVLAGVPLRDAGSASGLLSTAQQLGGAIGVAVIGVVFFGLLASQAPASADAVTPRIRSGLTAAGVPAPVRQQVVAGVRSCFIERTKAKDPTVVPLSCQQLGRAGPGSLPAAAGRRINQVITPAAAQAVQLTFSRAAERALRWEAGAFLLAFLLSCLLPAKARGDQPAPEQPSPTVT